MHLPAYREGRGTKGGQIEREAWKHEPCICHRLEQRWGAELRDGNGRQLEIDDVLPECVRVCVHVRACACGLVCMCVCMCACVCVCMYKYAVCAWHVCAYGVCMLDCAGASETACAQGIENRQTEGTGPIIATRWKHIYIGWGSYRWICLWNIHVYICICRYMYMYIYTCICVYVATHWKHVCMGWVATDVYMSILVYICIFI